MKERPILFSAPMVRALLSGAKTQTRRIVKPQPENGADLGFLIPQPNASGSCAHFHDVDERGIHTKELTVHCPYGRPGDRMWVRETWAYGIHALAAKRDEDGPFVYAADNLGTQGRLCNRWRPSIHMPRCASRILLEVASVRVERLTTISVSDAIAEGFDGSVDDPIDPSVKWYSRLWESINGAGSWAANPWVWVIEFRRGEQ